MLFCMRFFFFFKQKMAYEMRISDWSSDVCSSDLCLSDFRCSGWPRQHSGGPWKDRKGCLLPAAAAARQSCAARCGPVHLHAWPLSRPCRSEEHTSELQSLMRISYAVFCLKKKTEKYKTIKTCISKKKTHMHIH